MEFVKKKKRKTKKVKYQYKQFDVLLMLITYILNDNVIAYLENITKN